jgi:hypothetical protein
MTSASASVRELIMELRLERYPTHVEFRNAGLGGLYATIADRLGGHPGMAARLGMAMKTRRWDMDSASVEVRTLAEELHLDRYPTAEEFRNAGFVGLHDSIAKRLGGHAAMATRLGLARSDTAEPHSQRAVVQRREILRYRAETTVS